MNTLVYADIPAKKASNASSISSTLQQLSLSFGVAAAGLTTAMFVPASIHSNPSAFIDGIHKAFIVLGAFTVISSIIFWHLQPSDGKAESEQRHEGALAG
jgi:hypothetical protein